MSSIAFIDFDGTLYDGDSMLDFIRFCKGNKTLKWNLFLTSPQILLKKLSILPSQVAKEKLLRLSLGGMEKEELKGLAKQFSLTLDKKLYPKAELKLKEFINNKTQIVIVSASCGLWLGDWCRDKGFGLIASKEAYLNNKITGKLIGKNCKGPEKAKQIIARYPLDSYQHIYAFGNDASDQDMIELANQPTEALYE